MANFFPQIQISKKRIIFEGMAVGSDWYVEGMWHLVSEVMDDLERVASSRFTVVGKALLMPVRTSRTSTTSCFVPIDLSLLQNSVNRTYNHAIIIITQTFPEQQMQQI